MEYVERIDFPGLSQARLCAGTETAQRFLASAYDSVSDLFDWHQSVQELANEELDHEPELGARTQESAQDMLRSMIVFAGAGIDSVMKQLIRDTLDQLLVFSSHAREKFQTFSEGALDVTTAGAGKRLARYLTSPDPRQALTEEYIYELTGASLQSVEQLEKAMGALGLTESALRRRAKDLKPLFTARNQIVHELDLQQPGTHGDRNRRTRDMKESMALAHLGLEIGQQVINGVGEVLSAELN